MIRQVRELGFIEPGAPSYPSGFHSVTAWLSSAMDVPGDADSLWRAVQPLAFLMLGLMLTAVGRRGNRATHLLLGAWTEAYCAGAIAAAAFLQTAWFSTFLAFGNVMNMVVGACLLALLLNGSARQARTALPRARQCARSVIAVTANAWQLLLPVVGLGALPWIVHFIGWVFGGRHSG